MTERARRFLPVLLLLLSLGSVADAGDLTAFAIFGNPGENWNTGYGAALSWGILPFLAIEGEAARVPASLTDSSMTSFTASAFVSPPTGNVSIYGGLGVGYFRQSVGNIDDSGVLTAFIIGVKAKVGGVLVLKGEYRKLRLGENPLANMDSRFAAGAGISF
jgi:opacity protein-like surface antigen